MSNIKPELPGGFKDYLPEDSKKRDFLIGKIKKTFERFGFSLLETPAVESLETLTGGEGNINKQIFEVNQISSDKKSKMGLRFDLTVPLARVVASYNNEINFPAKFYRLGRVWRGEKSQAGRYREFLQCDVDILGASGVEADAEMVALIYATLIDLGIKKFKIKINSRELLNKLFESLKIEKEKYNSVLIAIDKLDKTSWEEVANELNRNDISNESAEEIKKFIESDLEKVKNDFKDNKGMLEEVEKIEELINVAEVLGVERSQMEINLSIVRGLGYYTGLVFETTLTDNVELGSVFSGGRYDNLIEKFTSSNISATGVSLGFDRLYEGIKDLDIFANKKTVPSVLILNFEESCRDNYFKALQELRQAGISSSIYMGQEDNLKGQLSYAVKEGIPVVLIMGKKEKEEGIFQIKDMEKRMQDSVSLEYLVEKVKESLIN